MRLRASDDGGWPRTAHERTHRRCITDAATEDSSSVDAALSTARRMGPVETRYCAALRRQAQTGLAQLIERARSYSMEVCAGPASRRVREDRRHRSLELSPSVCCRVSRIGNGAPFADKPQAAPRGRRVKTTAVFEADERSAQNG